MREYLIGGIFIAILFWGCWVIAVSTLEMNTQFKRILVMLAGLSCFSITYFLALLKLIEANQ